MTLTDTINEMFGKRASSPAQRAVNAGAPDAAENPTDGQKRVGNYRKVHLNMDGMRISIENPKGSVRSGTSPDGTKWSNTLACDYGDIRGTESVDGDPVDIYLSDHPEKGAVFVIDQVDPKTGKFDEHKVMYGFDSIEDAKKTYLACYQKGWGGLGWITPVTKAEFRKWIDSSTRKTKPFHEYASVKPIVDTIKVKAASSIDAKDYDYVLEKDGYVSGGTAKVEFDAIIKAFKDKYGVDLSHMRMKWSKHPRYVNGKVSHDFADDETVGSHGGDSVIYINPNLRSVMDRFSIQGKVKDLRRWSIAHELAHELQANYSDAYAPDFVKKMVDEAKKNKFRTMYTDMVPKEKFDKELFAEYMAKLLTDDGKINVEKSAESDAEDDPEHTIPEWIEKAAGIYEPPYTIAQIRKIYGDEVADRLSKDPVHKWRAETGIELIHKEPTLDELKRIIANWELMSEIQKKLSDAKSIELFKMTNAEHAKALLKTAQENQDDPMEGVSTGVKLRSFIDAPATRTAIMDNVLEAVQKRFPVEDDDVRLELRDVKYEGPTSYTLQQQKDALLNNRRLGCRIAGTWRLIDKRTGQVLDERRDGVLRVPYYTDRGTIINNGNEYTVISQARLSPGVYVRKKQNGELESQFNVANGLGFRIGLDKETGALNMSIGQGHVPLYPVLHALGVSDEDMRKSWGSEVTNVNIGKFDPRALDKVYARYAGRKADMSLTPQEKAAFISEALSKSGLDPDVVTRTLGLENVNGVTGAVMLRAAQKLLNINRGAEDPDERDNPRFSKFFGVEDMLRERIDRDSGRLTKSLLFRAKRDKNLGRIARNALAPYLDTFLSGSGLAMPGEEANPLSILTQQSRITRLGEGGISSPDLVTPEARNVQGDYLGYVDFISGPESFGIGIDVRAALGTMKGSDNRLYNKMMDLRTGKTRYVALDDAASHTVAFPGQDPKAPQLYAMRKGVPTMVPREEVDFMVPGFGNTVSAGINMTPMPTAVQAGRQFYMSKFWEQYLPQKEGEVPLVDSLMDDGKTTYSEFYGRKIGCLTAPFAGTVTKVTDNEITIRGKDGQTHTASLVKGLPFNRLSSISFTPQVKKGDEVEEGGLLANSNFTDAKTGAMNMGRNLKVAVLPAPEGVSSFEDAIVISESAAKKLATSRTYNFETEQKDGVKIARNKYLAAFPKAYTKEQADTIDDNGVVKVGTVLHRDDPMILAIGPKMLSGEDAQLGRLSGVLRNALTDKSTKWEHDWPGVVTDVVYGPNGAKVLVNSEPPVQIGDKIVPEAGLKGVCGGILPTDKMPRDAVTNEPYDMLMNPMGFLSRVAPNQVMLMNLAKVAKKTGKQIRIPQTPPPEGWQAYTERLMAENGVKETADVFDPQTGRTIKNVGDGYAYVKAFHHLAEKKFSARGVEGAYTQDEQPAKGGEDGAKRLSMFDQTALLSHGATDVIKDAMTIRGSYNDEYWRRYRLGLPVEEPGVPFIYQKFLNTLRAGGVNVVEKGDVTSIMPQTDDDIDELAQGRVLENSQMVDANMVPVKGGMFDLGKTGGMGGNRWSMITLPESVPNPMMEEPVRRVLGLTAKKMEAVLSGREELDGKTGGDAIKAALGKINIDREIEKARADVQNRRGSQRDNAVKVLGYLKAAKEMNIHPQDWMISKVPVLPPMFRPVAKMGDVALVPDMNELYKELIEMKQNYEMLSKELPASALADERLAVYGAVKAAYGLGESITTEGRAKNLKGAIKQVIGTVPKCYDSATELLTKRGWVSFCNVCDEDVVATVNQATLKMEWQSPSEVIHADYNGMMVHTKSRKIDLLVTPNHTHFVQCRVSPFVKRAKERSEWHGWRKMEAAAVMYGGSRMHMMTAPCGYAGTGEPDFANVSDKMAFAFLCGMYVAEGWDTKYSANICQTSANPEICDKIRKNFIDSGVKYTENTFKKKRGRTSTYWSIHSKEASDWFRTNFGHLAGGKKISEVVLEWAPKYLRQFIDGYLYGDGSKEHGRKDPDTNKTCYNKDIMTCEHSRASTTSRELVDDIAELCMKIGLGFRLTDIKNSGNPKWNTQYRFRIDGWNKVVIEGRKYHKWEMYNGQVHCVTVPNGLLVVRRNGCTAVSGNSGVYQSKVISKTQDLVGRSVISPNKNLDMDQIGIPEEMAWTMFKPFVERKLVQRGYSPVIAKNMIDERNATAKHILEDVMSERPVLMDRAPTWHKFNIMAFRPHLVHGRTINVCPLVYSPMAGDNDGDTVNIHVPASEKAAKQALETMLPSKNLFSLTDLKSVRYKPEKEQISGLWALTRGKTKKPVKVFASKAEAIKAYRNGEIGPNDPIEIANVK